MSIIKQTLDNITNSTLTLYINFDSQSAQYFSIKLSRNQTCH